MKNKIDNKEERIYNSTMRLISDYGFHGTSISKISKDADVSNGIIYFYFENKEDLINKLYLKLKKELSDALKINKNDISKKSYFEFLNSIYEYSKKNQDAINFLSQFYNSPYLTKETTDEVNIMFSKLVDFNKTFIEKGIVKDVDNSTFLIFTYNLIVNYVKLINENSIGTKKEQIFEMIWRGIEK